MGISSKKQSSNQTTNTTEHLTQTPTNPEFVTNGLAGLGGSIMDLSKLDPYSLVAGPDSLQTQAAGSAAGLGVNPDVYRAALDGTGAVMNAPASATSFASAAPFINRYMSPYINDVVNTTLKGYDDNANQTRQGQMLDLANDSTFGGSGGSILRALTEGQIGQGRAAAEAQLRQQGFETALGAANNDANRSQQTNDLNAQLRDSSLARTLAAAGQLGQLGFTADENQRADIGTQGDLGAQLQEIAQTKATAPLSLLGTQAALFSGLPLNLLHGQTGDSTSNSTSTGTATVSDPFGAFSGLLSGAGSLAQGLGALGIGFGKKGS
jgi:hypothetical protein